MENGGRGHGKEEKAVGHLNDWRGKAFSGSRIMFAFMLMFYAALMTSQCHRGVENGGGQLSWSTGSVSGKWKLRGEPRNSR